MRRQRATLAVLLLVVLTTTTSGCLANDLFPPPTSWSTAFQGGQNLTAPSDHQTKHVALRNGTDRVQFILNVTVNGAGTPPLGIGSASPGVNVTFHLQDGRSYSYDFPRSGNVTDMILALPPGPLGITVASRGAGSWHLDLLQHAPVYQHYRWWAFWNHG